MNPTRATLIARLRDRDDGEAWERFQTLYGPLIRNFARAQGLSDHDADEVRDQCFEVVVRRMREFQYDAGKAGFKAWLYRIVRGKVIDHLRRKREVRVETEELRGLVDPAPTAEELWNTRWEHEHLLHGLDRARALVSPLNWRAFEMLLLEDASVAQVCDALGLNANQVYKAKARVLESVREVLRTAGADEEIAGAD